MHLRSRPGRLPRGLAPPAVEVHVRVAPEPDRSALPHFPSPAAR